MRYLLFTILACVCSLSLNAVVHLTQSDFDSGTYRIKVADTYILDEDIQFQPLPAAEATRSDKPITGWFAAITVETDNVVIDLNGKTLQASQFYVDNFIFNVFADIELDNSPFPGILFGLVGASFPGDASFVSASNVIVKNGTLGLSSHWGLRGDNNTNVELANLEIKDFQVAGISLNGILDANIHDVNIGGTERDIRISFVHAAATALINYLADLTETGFPGAAEQLAALTLFVGDNPEIFNTVSPIPENSVFGVLISSGFSSIANFPTTPDDCAFAAFLANGRTAEHVAISNVHVKNLKSSPEEVALIGSQITGGVAFNLGQAGILTGSGLPIIACPRWVDAFDANGNFAPNPFLQAMAFAANVALSLNPAYSIFLPPNFAQITASILASDETAFFAETLPIFGLQLDSFPVKGNFGFRVDCSATATLTDCTACNIENLGRLGIELSDLPGSEHYPNLVQVRYAGNDVWGFETGTSDLVAMDHCTASGISTLWGDAFGFHVSGFSSNIELRHCKAKNISGFSDITNSIVNLPSEVYGFEVENNPGPITLHKCWAENIEAPRFAFGFSDEESSDVHYSFCMAKKIRATSSSNLAFAKGAFGFDLQGATDTTMRCIFVSDVAITGEKCAHTSNSIAAGIFIDSQSDNTKICCPKIEKIKGGAGQAFKIKDDGTNTHIKRCRH